LAFGLRRDDFTISLPRSWRSVHTRAPHTARAALWASPVRSAAQNFHREVIQKIRRRIRVIERSGSAMHDQRMRSCPSSSIHRTRHHGQHVLIGEDRGVAIG
jgi:hypothetical protein